MSYKNLIFEEEDKIGIIKINRPEVRNVLNWETWMELEDALRRLHTEPKLRAGIIIGVGEEAFIAGADLNMLKDRTPQDAIDASMKANEILLFYGVDGGTHDCCDQWLGTGRGLRDRIGL